MSQDDNDSHEMANTDGTADIHDMADSDDMAGSEELADIDEVEALLDRLISGADPAPDGPAWGHNVALLVRAAQAPARDDELAGEDDLVRRMAEICREVAGQRNGGHDGIVAGATGIGATVTRLADHRRRDREDRNYRAKHAAARLEASRHPAVRTVGRVIAMKAAAVTTAAVIGVAAAAAATTGIVATVVVPAISGDGAPEPDPAPTTTLVGRRPEARTGAGTTLPFDTPAPAVCPMVPTCTMPPPTASTPATTATTAPTATATTVDRDADDDTAATTTTVVEATTTTTVPTPTTVETTTTTTVDPEPDPALSMLSADTGGGGGGSPERESLGNL